MLSDTTIRFFGATVITSLLLVYSVASNHRSSISDNQADSAIRRLWSADDSERKAGKEELIRLGPRAITPLIELLQKTKRPSVAYYATGKEKEAERISRHLNRASKIGNRKEIEETSKQLANIEITSRLRNDAIELLGKLRAEQAIPELIELIVQEPKTNLSREYWRPEMKALVDIGSPAVASLLESIESARAKVMTAQLHKGLSKKLWQELVESDTCKIQIRAVMVLGEIRQVQALPVLHKLLETARDRLLKYYTNEAINKIQETQR